MNIREPVWPRRPKAQPNSHRSSLKLAWGHAARVRPILVSLAIATLLLLATGPLAGCSRQQATPTPPPTAGTPDIDLTATATAKNNQPKSVVILVAGEITTLDPYRMVNVHPEGSVAFHVWDTLTVLNDDLQVEPHLATSWRLINNFTWEFTLRQGITFHNGEPLDAKAVRFSAQRAQSPDSLETFAQDTALQSVEVTGEYTVRFVTSRPNSNLPFHLSALEILPPTYYAETDPDQAAQAPVGSGPYKVKEFDPGNEVILEGIPTYWKGAPAWPTLVFRTVPDAGARMQALGDGEAALITDLPVTAPGEWNVAGSRLEAVESTQRLLVGIYGGPNSPLASKDVRQALNYGINVDAITEEWLKGYGTRYGSWVNPPANDGQLEPWPYDPGHAAELLIQAGYPDGFATTLVAPSDAYYESQGIAEAIAEQLGQIGVTIEVEIVDWDTFAGRLLSGSPPALFLLGMNSRGDGLEDVKNLSVGFRFNPTGWQNEAFEQAVERAQNSFNVNARSRALNDAQSIAYEEAPWIWLWRQYRFYGISDRLEWTPRRDGLVHVYGLQAQEQTN